MNAGDQPSEIIFQLKNDENPFFISPDVPYDQLLENVKLHFKIPMCSKIAVIDSYTNRTIVVARTAELFNFTNVTVPKYKIIIEGTIL